MAAPERITASAELIVVDTGNVQCWGWGFDVVDTLISWFLRQMWDKIKCLICCFVASSIYVWAEFWS